MSLAHLAPSIFFPSRKFKLTLHAKGHPWQDRGNRAQKQIIWCSSNGFRELGSSAGATLRQEKAAKCYGLLVHFEKADGWWLVHVASLGYVAGRLRGSERKVAIELCSAFVIYSSQGGVSETEAEFCRGAEVRCSHSQRLLRYGP